MQREYYVAFFDILGFKNRLSSMGLAEVLARYEALIETVTYREKSLTKIFGEYGFKESPYWTSDGDVFLFTKTRGAYASDSLLIWENRFWPEARDLNNVELQEKNSSPENSWKFKSVPCDNFLDICNELMCRGLEVGLPLRGAIASGQAVLDLDRNIFLGQPIIDASSLQTEQKMISTSFCNNANLQSVPNRYVFKYDLHTKEQYCNLSNGLILDWPRHWRNTRKTSLVSTINALDTSPASSSYYKNTLELIAHSEQFSHMYESLEETSIRNSYEQFSWSIDELSIPARAVRTVPI